jgi:hypothetical protein
MSSILTPTPKVADATTPTSFIIAFTVSIERLINPDCIAIGVPRLVIIPTYLSLGIKLCGLKSKPKDSFLRYR